MGGSSGASSEYRSKALRMLEAARRDLEMGLSEKAASAAYFAAEAALNSVSVERQGSVPVGFRSRLRLVERWFGAKARGRYALLHHLRVRADHGRAKLPRKEAREALELAEEIVSLFLGSRRE